MKIPVQVVNFSACSPPIGMQYIPYQQMQTPYIQSENMIFYQMLMPKAVHQSPEPPHREQKRVPKQRLRTASSGTRTSSGSNRHSLPSWALDKNNEMYYNLTIADVLEHDSVVDFAMEKLGCQFLQENFDETTHHQKIGIINSIIGKRDTFLKMCKNVFANYFVQRILDELNQEQTLLVIEHISHHSEELSVDKFACRVIQKLIEKPNNISKMISYMLMEKSNPIHVCTSQSGNHVLQKLIKETPLSYWKELIYQLESRDSNVFLDVGLNRFGCRVIQAAINELSNPKRDLERREERQCGLKKIMSKIIFYCRQLACSDHGNYLIQFILSAPSGCELEPFRDEIITKCLCRNLLSLSQEKFSSHVVQCAFDHAPVHLLAIMLDEIFEGYVPHPETGKDAVDILMFHQYGNYVFQTILIKCCKFKNLHSYCSETGEEKPVFQQWLKKIQQRVYKEKIRLDRFSSGKKIIAIMHQYEDWGTSGPSRRGSCRSDLTTSCDEYSQ